MPTKTGPTSKSAPDARPAPAPARDPGSTRKPAGPCRVFLVDDNPAFLLAVEDFLASSGGFEVVGRATSGREALDRATLADADLILMDFSMPGMDGLEATRRLAARPAAPPVVIMTVHEQAEYRRAAERAGAAGFLVKSRFGDDLLPLMRRVVPTRVGPVGRPHVISSPSEATRGGGPSALPGPAAADTIPPELCQASRRSLPRKDFDAMNADSATGPGRDREGAGRGGARPLAATLADLVQRLAEVRDGAPTLPSEVLDQWSDREHLYLEATLADDHEFEIDLNVQGGRAFIRVSR